MATDGQSWEGIEQMLSIDDVARILQISKKSVYRHVKKGTLRAYKIGGFLRFKADDVKAFIEAHEKK